MKKEEKTKQTCEKIVHAATIEFGSRSYDAVSLNAICGKYQIAKGLIYHNFKNNARVENLTLELYHKNL